MEIPLPSDPLHSPADLRNVKPAEKSFKIQGEGKGNNPRVDRDMVTAEIGRRTYQVNRRKGHLFNKCLKQALRGPKNESITP